MPLVRYARCSSLEPGVLVAQVSNLSICSSGKRTRTTGNVPRPNQVGNLSYINFGVPADSPAEDSVMLATLDRISPQQAVRDLQSKSGTLLVCAYDSDEKFRSNHLEGAIPLSSFRAMEDRITSDREIIFYCA
jgi:hypothetical protein